MLLAFCLANSLPSAAASERPNIVWLISEDNSSHYLKLFDSNGAETPAISKLAETGLIFEHAFSNAPVCSVARTTLMTSCYAPRIGTQFHRRSVTVPMPPNVKMFPAYLRDAGYYTTNNQKKDYNAVETQGTWDASSNKASWRNRKEGQPFFHMQSFGTSHESSLHFSQKIYDTENTTTDPDSVFVPPYFPDTPLFRYTIARYHDKIQAVDRQIGSVVEKLAEDGLLDSTFIFYFGDHGGVLPRGKGYAYESGLHVPLVVHVPEKFADRSPWPSGSKVDDFVEFIDFGATALHLAGIELPAGIDGRPFLGEQTSAADLAKRDSALGYADRFDEKYDLVRTLRKGKYEYVRNYQPFNIDGLQNNYRYIMLAYREWRELFKAGKLDKAQSQFFRARPAEQLFDIESDPHEVNNLAADPAYQATLTAMRGELRTRLKDLPDLSFYPENYLAANAFEAPTAFGKSRQDEIAELIDIADLCLVPFTEARSQLESHLSSATATERYWALIACTAIGKEALSLEKEIRSCLSDSDLLVRTRAAECLALLLGEDPEPTLKDCLAQSTSGIQTNLILNTAVLLRDSAGFEMNINSKDIHPGAADFQDVKRRLAYLESEDGIPKNPRGTKSKTANKRKDSAKAKVKSKP